MGEVVDLRRRIEEVSVAAKATTEEVSWLRADLDHKTVDRSNREELEQLRGEMEKKGLEMLKRDSELQRKELVLQTAQRELEEIYQRAEGAEATLRSEQDAIKEARECLKYDLSRAWIAEDAAEAQEQATIDRC